MRTEKVLGRDVLVVPAEALKVLAEEAYNDINHYLRPGHLQQLRNILDDARSLRQRQVRRLRLSQERQYRGRRHAADVPGHRHRIIMGKQRAQCVWVEGNDEAALAEGARDCYLKRTCAIRS